MHAKMLQSCSTDAFVTPWTVAHQAPLFMGFSRQEYWSGLPCPPPRDLPDPRSNLYSLCFHHWQAGSLPQMPRGKPNHFVSSVQFSRSVVSDSLRPHGHQASLSITNSWSLLKPMSIESVMLSNHLILCWPLLPKIFSSIRVFSNESVLHIKWPKYWSFSSSISPSGLISFRID